MILDDRDIERWREAGWWGTTTVDDLFRACVAARPRPARAGRCAEPRGVRARRAAAADVRRSRRARRAARGRRCSLPACARTGSSLVQLPNIVEIVHRVPRLRAARRDRLADHAGLRRARPAAHRRATCGRRPFLTLRELKDGAPRSARGEDRAGFAVSRRRFRRDRRRRESAVRSQPASGAGDATARQSGVTSPGLEQLPGDVDGASAPTSRRSRSTPTRSSRCTGPPAPPAIRSACRAATTSGTAPATPAPTPGCCEPGDASSRRCRWCTPPGYSGMFMPWLETQGMLALHQPFDMGVFLDQIEAGASTTPSPRPRC